MKRFEGAFNLAALSVAMTMMSVAAARAASPEMPAGAVSASDTHTNGMLRVSGEYPSDGHFGWKLFDRNFGNKWLTPSRTGWAVYQFANGDRWAVTNYIFSSGGDAVNRDPKIWRIEGANDLKGGGAADIAAATWRLVDSREMAAHFPARNTRYAFSCESNANAYNAYRLVIDNTFGENMIQIGDWMLDGNAGAARFCDAVLASHTDTEATLGARFEAYDLNEAFTVYALCSTTDWGSDFASWPAGSATLCVVPQGGVLDVTLTGLAPDTPYVARFYAANAGGEIEAWTDAIAFATYTSEPQVVTLPAESVDANSAVLSGDFIFAAGGHSTAVVTLYWATAAQTNDWLAAPSHAFPAQGPARLSYKVTGLDLATTYYFRHRADNGVDAAWSAETLEFTTFGLPVFGAPAAAGYQDEVRVGVSLASTGAAGSATVSLWQGSTPDTLACVKTWPAADGPEDYSFATNITRGATQCFVFRADSVLPNTPPSPAFVETPPLFVTQDNRFLSWKSLPPNTLWDAANANWDHNGATAVFNHGDSAAINNPPNNSSITLAQDIAADAVEINLGGGTWTLAGEGRTLDLHSGLAVNARGATVNIDAPRVSGPGGVALNKGALWLSNPANDYAGGTAISEGRLNIRASADNATPLGSGDIVLGSANDPEDAAHLMLTRPDSATPFALDFAGDLAAVGGGNAALVTLDAAHDASAAISARFNAIRHSPGGAMILAATRNNVGNPGGPNEYIFLDNPPAGVFPPWFVISRYGGGYAEYDPARGIVRTELPLNQIPPDGSPARFEGLTLSADASINAAEIWYTLDLAGHALNLGVDGAAGLIMRQGAAITNSVPGSGGINLAGNELYLYNEQTDACVRIPIDGTVRKFGDGDLGFSHSIPAVLHNQQGRVSFRFDTPTLATASALRGAGTYHTRDTATEIIFQGHDSPLRFNHLEMVGGAITLTQGDSLIYGHAYIGPDNAAYQGNPSSLALRGAARLDVTGPLLLGYNSRSNTLAIADNAALAGAGQVEVGAYGSHNSLFISGNGGYDLSHTSVEALRVGNNGGSNSNLVEVSGNGRFASVGGFRIGKGGSYNTFIARDNAAVAMNALIVGMDGASTRNALIISDAAELSARGNIEIGANGSRNTLIISNGLFSSASTAGESLRIGTHLSHSNRVELAGAGRFILAGSARVGARGSFNTLRIADDSLFSAQTLTLSESTSEARSNQLILAGGSLVCTNLILNATSILTPEIQPDGLRHPALVRARATFNSGTLLRPTAARGALAGEHAVLRAEDGIIDNGLELDVPSAQISHWKWRISADNTTLYVRFAPPQTVLIIR